MKSLFAEIWKKEFIRNSTKLLSANAIGQLVAFLLLPFVTRIFSEHDMGVLGLFLSVSGFLALFAGAKYEFAILLENDRNRAAAVFDLSFLLNLSFSLCIALFLFAADDWVWSFLGYDSLLPYSQMIPVFIFLSSLGLTLTYWFNYNKQFSHTAAYNLEQVLSNNLMKVGFGAFSAGPTSLIAANQLSYVVALFLSLCRSKKIFGLFRFSRSLMTDVAKVHRKFPKYYLPHVVVNFFSANLVVLLLSGPFGLKVIGCFSVAIMLGSRPIGLISFSLEQVLSQNFASKVGHMEPILPSVLKLSWRVLGLALPVFALVFFLLPWVVDWYLGANWSEVALYLRLLLPFLLFTLLCGPISFIPSLIGAQGKALFIEIGILAVRIVVLLIGVWADSFVLALGLFSVASTGLLIGQYFWYLSLVKQYERSLLRPRNE